MPGPLLHLVRVVREIFWGTRSGITSGGIVGNSLCWGSITFIGWQGGQPFAGAGFSFRTIGIESSGYSVTGTGAAPVYTPFDSHYRAELAVGAVAAAGLRYKVGRFSVVPQIRYTRWGIGDSLSRKNAFGAFLGVTF